MRLLLLVVVVLAGCASPDVAPTPVPPSPPSPSPTPSPPPPVAEHVVLEPFLEGFSRPLLLTPDRDGALYVVEQDGRIWRVEGGERSLWLDLDERVGSSGNEQGLLGLAFEPGGTRAYVSYTDNDGDSVLSRIVDGQEEVVLRVEQPYSNHNGGHVAFGPDGMLWYGLGDGGSANDPHGYGQDREALLGSMLRLDVSGASGYAVPPDNPYAGGGGAREVWAKGLRNPWRFSFDRATGDLFIADVGQGAREEIDYAPSGAPGGANFGWPAYEGNERHELRQATSEVTPPVVDYPLRVNGRCAVIGGHVYRGAQEPALVGAYLYGDHCSGEIWALRFVGGAWVSTLLLDSDVNVTSFGEDADGELYVVGREGAIWRVRAPSPS